MARAFDPKRNMYVLAGAQALGGSAAPLTIALGGLVGVMLASNKALGTLPVSLYTIGLALSTIPVAMLSRAYGRRAAYTLAAFFGMAGGLIAAYGIVQRSFEIFCLGTLLTGINGAAIQSYRFAATDSVPSEMKGRAISVVLVGGLAAGVIGPELANRFRELVPGVPFSGSFFGQAALALLALPLIAMLRSPPVSAEPASGGRPLMEIARTPRFVMAAGTGIISYALMSLVMTAAPIAMIGCGLSPDDAGNGIRFHVLAMFAPSFVTGHLIQRFNAERITALGLVLIAVGSVVALTGLTVAHFWIDLILLGVGWNFGFIGATTMIASSHRPEERAKVQGANDFLVFGSVAVASLASGGLLEFAGWETIVWLTFPIVGLALLLIFLAGRSSRRTTAVPRPAE